MALNYQKFDSKIWLNQGKFRLNGGCGFVLKPELMLNSVSTGVVFKSGSRRGSYQAKKEENEAAKVPNKAKQLTGHSSIDVCGSLPWELDPLLLGKRILRVTIVSGHYLPTTVTAMKNNRKEIINPYVDVSLNGLHEKVNEYKQKFKTKIVVGNGFNPEWRECFDFEVLLPELSLLSFVVRSKESGTVLKGSFVAQQVIPVNAIRSGFRVVPLLFLNGAKMDSSYLFCRFVWI